MSAMTKEEINLLAKILQNAVREWELERISNTDPQPTVGSVWGYTDPPRYS